MAIAVTVRATGHTTPALDGTGEELSHIRESIERMRVRVNASHAQHESLHRAALGIRTIHSRLEAVLQIHVAQHSVSPDNRLAASALQATQQHLRFVLESDHTVPIEEQRAYLNHVLARITEALQLLDHEC